MTEQMNVPKLRFGEFTSNWEYTKLGELSTIRSASRVHREQWTESGVPFFRSSDVVAAYKGNDNNRAFISNELFEALSKKSGKPKKNDLLVTGGGSIGIPYLVPNDAPLYFKDADLLWFKNKEELNGYFLYEFLITSKFRRYLASITHTGTISHYTIEQAKATPITYPTLPEQQKIASFLSKVDEKIGLLSEKKDKLTEYKRGVMQQLFNGKWHEQDGQLTFTPPTLRFKADDGSEFPDWEEKTIGNLGRVVTGSTPKTSEADNYGGDKMFISPADLDGKKFIYSTKTLVTQKGFESGRIIPKESICFVCIGSTIGKIALNANEAITNQQINSIIVEGAKFVSGFVFAALEKEAMKIKNLAGEQAVPIINKSEFSKYKLLVPTKAEQTHISNFLSVIDQKIDLANSELNKAKEWKKGLLQQMFV